MPPSRPSVVGSRVAPDHGRGGVTEQVLDIDLTGRRPNGHRREGVAKTVGVDVGDARLLAQAVVQHDQPDRGERPTAPGLEEGARFPPAEVEVAVERDRNLRSEGDHPLLLALAVEDPRPASREVHIFKPQPRRLRGRTPVSRRKRVRAVLRAPRRVAGSSAASIRSIS